jgi:hypothetical protein
VIAMNAGDDAALAGARSAAGGSGGASGKIVGNNASTGNPVIAEAVDDAAISVGKGAAVSSEGSFGTKVENPVAAHVSAISSESWGAKNAFTIKPQAGGPTPVLPKIEGPSRGRIVDATGARARIMAARRPV